MPDEEFSVSPRDRRAVAELLARIMVELAGNTSRIDPKRAIQALYDLPGLITPLEKMANLGLPKEALETPVEQLHFRSLRLYRRIKTEGLHTIGELLDSHDQLEEFWQLGAKGIREIELLLNIFLEKRGYLPKP